MSHPRIHKLVCLISLSLISSLVIENGKIRDGALRCLGLLEMRTIPVSFSASSCHTVWWHFMVGMCVCPPSFPGCEFSIPSEAKGRERTDEREGEEVQGAIKEGKVCLSLWIPRSAGMLRFLVGVLSSRSKMKHVVWLYLVQTFKNSKRSVANHSTQTVSSSGLVCYLFLSISVTCDLDVLWKLVLWYK